MEMVTAVAVAVDQNNRLVRMDAAKLDASIATRDRLLEEEVLEYASAWSLAIPKRPTASTTSDTKTSTRLKPWSC
jgi:hypothetical protein